MKEAWPRSRRFQPTGTATACFLLLRVRALLLNSPNSLGSVSSACSLSSPQVDPPPLGVQKVTARCHHEFTGSRCSHLEGPKKSCKVQAELRHVAPRRESLFLGFRGSPSLHAPAVTFAPPLLGYTAVAVRHQLHSCVTSSSLEVTAPWRPRRHFRLGTAAAAFIWWRRRWSQFCLCALALCTVSFPFLLHLFLQHCIFAFHSYLCDLLQQCSLFVMYPLIFNRELF